MKRVMLGALVCLCVVVAMTAVGVAGQRNEVPGPRPVAGPAAPVAVSGGELIVVPTAVGDKGQLLTVVDARRRVMGVYHIDLATGKIELRSVRSIDADLQMPAFNTGDPKPEEILLMLGPK